MPKPTAAELIAAQDRTVPDILAKGLDVVFCGINPSLYSAAVGHHFGRPGNRFWKAIHRAGYTDRLLAPDEDRRLIEYGCGVTNLVDRATARADELSAAELLEGSRRLVRKLKRCGPSTVAFLGVTAYRAAFLLPKAAIGLQQQTIGATKIWVLPNPSGLNAHYQIDDLAALYRQVRPPIHETDL